MKPQLADAKAERMLKEAKYNWSDGTTGICVLAAKNALAR
jgi:hypothetical protein